jgi:hypothetical protein
MRPRPGICYARACAYWSRNSLLVAGLPAYSIDITLPLWLCELHIQTKGEWE